MGQIVWVVSGPGSEKGEFGGDGLGSDGGPGAPQH